MYKRILVPLDGSEHAEAVLPFMCMLARVSGAEIILLRVSEYPLKFYTTNCYYSPADPRLAQAIERKKMPVRNEVKRYLKHIALNLEKEGYQVITEVRDEPVVESILNATEYLCADLITMATHTYSRYTHWLIVSLVL